MITTSTQHLLKHFTKLLSPIYELDEARNISFLLLESKLKLSKAQILSSQNIISFPSSEFNTWVARLLRYEPIQYILGETEFMGRTFLVNPNVLIPRPETEELVNWILENNRKQPHKTLRLLDVGTGSGCIAVSLAAEIQGVDAWAIDISSEALAIAKENATRNNISIHFQQVDFLSNAFPIDFPDEFDCIVSNPPYVMEQEQDHMQPNVLKHEPHLALFVPDTDALVFYRQIARFCQQYLASDGKYYVEINENLAHETAQLMRDTGLTATIRNDMFGKPRMLSGEKMN